jgi:hypothetical protein
MRATSRSNCCSSSTSLSAMPTSDCPPQAGLLKNIKYIVWG